MPTIIDKILQPREINVDKVKLFDLLSESTIVIPGISDLNLEKSLSSVLPNIEIENIEIEELYDKFILTHNLKFSFIFDVAKVETFLFKYFKLNITSYSSDTPDKLINIQRKPLFYDKSYDSKKDFSFSVFRKKEFQDRFEYKATLNTEISKKKNGEFFFTPNYVFQVIKLYFDEDSFNKDFEISELGFDNNNNGKVILLSYYDNNVYNPYQFKLATERNIEWQSSFNIKDGEHYSYSFFTSDAQKLITKQQSIKQKIKLLGDLPILNLDSSVSERANEKYIHFHNKKYFTFPISLFFDINWHKLCLDKTIYKSLLQNNTNLINKFSIENITIKKHTENNVLLLCSLSLSDNQPILLEDDKVSLSEYILEDGLTKTFHLRDKTSTLTNFNGKVMYSIELTIKSSLESFLEEKKKEISKVYRDIQNYNFQIDNLTNENGEFVGDVKVDVDESLYVKGLQNYYNNLSLLTNNIDIKSELEKEYNNSNIETGTTKGRIKFQENINKLKNTFDKVSSYENSYINGKKISKNLRSLFSYVQNTEWLVLEKNYFDVLPNPDVFEYSFSEINNFDFAANTKKIIDNKEVSNLSIDLFDERTEEYKNNSQEFLIIDSSEKQTTNIEESGLSIINVENLFGIESLELSQNILENTNNQIRYFVWIDEIWKEIQTFSTLTDDFYLCKVEFSDNKKIGNNMFFLGELNQQNYNLQPSFVSLSDINKLRMS